MNKRIIFSFVSLIAVLCMAAMASAGQVTWTPLTDSSMINMGPGIDGLVGTSDDLPDGTRNPQGAFSVDATEWGTHDSSCPANDPGPDAVTYGASGSMRWCMGSPTSGQVEWTTLSLPFTPGLPAYFNLVYTYKLTQPPGGDDVGSPCGTGTVNSTVDLTISQIGYSYDIPDVSVTARVYDASTSIVGGLTCQRADGGTASSSQSELNAIRTLALGKGATALMVSCNATTFVDASPCFDGFTQASNWIVWTDDPLTPCDGSCGGGGCLAGTAEDVD